MDRPHVPGEILAVFPLNAPPELAASVARALGLARTGETGLVRLAMRIVRFRLRRGQSLQHVQARLQSDPRVLFVQPNHVYTLSAANSRQYALDRLHIGKIHAFSRGRGIRIGMIDSGVDRSHPALAGADIIAYDSGGGTRPAAHGTAIASILVARGDLTGLAPAATLLAVQAFGALSPGTAPRGTSFSILRGTEWAIDHGAHILNLSFTGPRDPLLHRQLSAAIRNGIAVVAAAGNGGPKAPPAYPAAYDGVIASTATDFDNRLYDHANRGDYITLAAPGVDILVASPGKAYSLISGTSMAAAHVSGSIALILAAGSGSDTGSVLDRITGSATDLGPPGKDPAFGHGLIDPEAALARRRPILPAAATGIH